VLESHSNRTHLVACCSRIELESYSNRARSSSNRNCNRPINLRIWLLCVWLLLPPLSLHSWPSHQCTTQPRGRQQWRPRWVAFLLSKAPSSAHRVVCRLPWRPWGSLATGIAADAKARATRSLSAWCLDGASTIIIINFICRHEHKTYCNTTEFNMVKYAEQDREVQKCSYLGPNGSEVAILFILILFILF